MQALYTHLVKDGHNVPDFASDCSTFLVEHTGQFVHVEGQLRHELRDEWDGGKALEFCIDLGTCLIKTKTTYRGKLTHFKSAKTIYNTLKGPYFAPISNR